MKKIASIIAMLVLFSAPSAKSMSVVEAMDGGYINLFGYASSGYSEVTLYVECIANVTIDFSTCYFLQPNETQRIGLTYEKTTLNYNLSFTGGNNHLIRFDARSLDYDRAVPIFDGDYTICVPFGPFQGIGNALRNNLTQGEIWDVTDGAGSYSIAWKRSDPRNDARGGSDGRPVLMSGSCSWRAVGKKLTINAGRIDNDSATDSTGVLCSQVWATKYRYLGGAIRGRLMGGTYGGPLEPKHYYPYVSAKVRFRKPPPGRYFTTITIGDGRTGFQISDFQPMPRLTRF